jgi:nucleotide sugar dehydrogenase
MRIAVVGLGKIGLPLAAQYASLGHIVFGCDANPSVVEAVNAGLSTFSGEPGLEQRVSEAVASGNLSATSDTEIAVAQSEAVVVVVPLLVDAMGTPDFSLLDSATDDIARGLRKGTLVCFETTLPVGTTRDRLAPLLEAKSGLVAGESFHLVFSPERVYSGRVFENLAQYPKLVGGVNDASASAGVSFYESVLTFSSRPDLAQPNGVWNLGSTEAAELAKLAETTYRDVNIALANQFALYSERVGIDVYKVIEACNSQPFSHIHQPGVAVGGHCIPVYPHMYLMGDPGATVVHAAREANKAMPSRVVERLEATIGDLSGLKIAILGLAYRGGVKEHAFSGAWGLVSEVKSRGGVPLVHDPLYSDAELLSLGLEPFLLEQDCDAVIIQANHAEYSGIDSGSFPSARLIYDGRNIIKTSSPSQGRIMTTGVGNS